VVEETSSTKLGTKEFTEQRNKVIAVLWLFIASRRSY
jgi:hypothetical protein